MTDKLHGVDEHQAAPVKNDRPCVQDLVIADLLGRRNAEGVATDLEARKQVGLQRYGTLLQPFNGRNAVLDAYQESLDLLVYLRQAREEGKLHASGVYESAIHIAIALRATLEGHHASVPAPARVVDYGEQ